MLASRIIWEKQVRVHTGPPAMEKGVIMCTDFIMEKRNLKPSLTAQFRAINASIGLPMAYINLHYSHSSTWLKHLSI